MKNRIYIAGPMTGYPGYNRTLFESMTLAATLQLGYRAVNPHEQDDSVKLDDRLDSIQAMTRYFADTNHTTVKLCDAILMLPEWETSKGARHEFALADRLGLELYECVEDPVQASGYRIELMENEQC